MINFRFLLFCGVFLIVNAKIVVAADFSATDFSFSIPVSMTHMENESRLIDGFRNGLGDVSEFPIFWKRELIALECSGNLVGMRLGFGTRGMTYQKVIGITPEQEEQILSVTKRNFDKYRALQNQIPHFREDMTFSESLNITDEMVHLILDLIKADVIALRKILMKEQLQRVRELELVLPPIIDNELEFSINFDAYEALELSDEQRNKLSEIKKQHAQLQDEVALMEAGFQMSVIVQEVKENPLKEYDYTMQRLLQKNELTRKVNTFKAEVKNSIFQILNQQQRNKLALLNIEVRQKLAIKRSEVKQEQKKTTDLKNHSRDIELKPYTRVYK
jgi:hypothetical protein